MGIKHTPGPWVASRGSFLFQIAINSESDTLAVVYGENGENEANARLICAAPELLEALTDALEDYDAWMKGAEVTPNESLQAWTNKARAAIAKAKGEDQ